MQAGMVAPPHPMAPGSTDEDYYRGNITPIGLAPKRASHRGRPVTVEIVAPPIPPAAPRPPKRCCSGSSARSRVGAVGVVAAPKAVYSAIFLAVTMIILAVLYIAQDAVFLGIVQVVVYTGAVMMLFLFVLMLIGVDSAEVLVETIRGQRFAAIVRGRRVRRPADRRHRQFFGRRVHRPGRGQRGGNVRASPRSSSPATCGPSS